MAEPPTKGQPPNNGQNACPHCVHYSEVPLYNSATKNFSKIEKSRVSGFSCGKLEAGRNELGLCTARYESNCEGLARLSRRVWRRFVHG